MNKHFLTQEERDIVNTGSSVLFFEENSRFVPRSVFVDMSSFFGV